METKFITQRREGRILYLTLSRPEVLNACYEDDHDEMAEIWPQIAADDDVDVVVLTGAGRAFSAGGHLDLFRELITDAATRERVQRGAEMMIHALVDFPKPLIVAMNGLAMTGGLALALMADIIIAERHVRLTDGHVVAGIAAGDGGVLTWPLYAGLLRAKRWLMTGDWISAEEACEIGLVTEVVDEGQSLARATEYAAKIAALPQDGVRSTKRALNGWQRLGLPIFDVSCGYEFANLASPRVREHAERLLAEHGK